MVWICSGERIMWEKWGEDFVMGDVALAMGGGTFCVGFVCDGVGGGE